MTQLIINIEKPSIVPIIKKMLGLIEGVTFASQKKVESVEKSESVENDAILSAFEQVKRIKDGTIKTRSVNDLLAEYGC